MWQIVEWLDCPSKFLKMIIQLHEDQANSKATVISQLFLHTKRVKQDCILTANLFSTMLKQATKDLDDGDGIDIRSCLHVSLFNLQSLKGHTKILEQLIRDLMFAENTALVAHTKRALQHISSCFRDCPALWESLLTWDCDGRAPKK